MTAKRDNKRHEMAILIWKRLKYSPVMPRGVSGSWYIYERLPDGQIFKLLSEDHAEAVVLVELFGDFADRLPEIWPLQSRVGSLVGFNYTQVIDDLMWQARVVGEVDFELYDLATDLKLIVDWDIIKPAPSAAGYRAPPDG